MVIGTKIIVIVIHCEFEFNYISKHYMGKRLSKPIKVKYFTLYFLCRDCLRKRLFLTNLPKWEETMGKEEADVENLFTVH